jgi:hypothetical protein
MVEEYGLKTIVIISSEEGEEKGATFSFSLYINEQQSY